MSEKIKIRGARVNNLKNLSLDVPRGKLVVVTGISGSGKSSLVFDTLYAEGQRRFSESLSSYARQFLGRMSKPDVDSIEGIAPAIAIQQKVTTRNPRSTVATTTEIYDFLRLIYARIGKTYSPISGEEVHSDSVADVMNYLSAQSGTFYILSELKWSQREDHTELLLSLKEEGFNRLYVDGCPLRIDDALQQGVDCIKQAYLLLDRARLDGEEMDADTRTRLLSSMQLAFSQGLGDMYLATDTGELKHFCSRFERDGMSFRQPDEYLFSFNSPLGACQVCGGLGKIIDISEDLVIPDKTKSIYDGAIACWRGEKMSWFKDLLIRNAQRYKIPIFEPYCKLTEAQRDIVWNTKHIEGDDNTFVGVREFFSWVETQRYKIQFKYMLSRFSGKTICHSCGGSRLRPEALWVKIGGKNIHEFLSLNVDQALDFVSHLQLSDSEREIIADPLSEITSRLQCLKDVGLSYLTLSRACNTLSGGESQRISLVTALGSSLVGSMYILDEPSIGLHPRDTQRLIDVLIRLRDLGNTVVVVEHDEEIIRAADHLIDIGPRAGRFGGELIFQGCLQESVPQDIPSLTLDYLTGRRSRYTRESRPWQYSITVKGAMENNLKDIDVRFPLGALTVVSGVSGSGKSSLVGDILYPAIYRYINEEGDQPGVFRGLEGNLDRITRVEYVDQNPIGRSSRSNAVTYLKAYDDIRKLFAQQQAAKIQGFGANHFSFNADGGRCPECQGEGVVHIEMQFMSDVTMICEECGGKRFKRDVLDVKYRGKNIYDVLNMSVDEAIEFFSEGSENEARSAAAKLQPLSDVGLGYIKLGQSSSTLSGGESQRIKLAYFLSLASNNAKKDKIMFIFDE
ncbi:MAG: excinuclease ABC subunit UvrA, partial [Bacteroidales bacterium]|nr:excinuclease ABC subunit UvrA [Bacteroidales bacterium]